MCQVRGTAGLLLVPSRDVVQTPPPPPSVSNISSNAISVNVSGKQLLTIQLPQTNAPLPSSVSSDVNKPNCSKLPAMAPSSSSDISILGIPNRSSEQNASSANVQISQNILANPSVVEASQLLPSVPSNNLGLDNIAQTSLSIARTSLSSGLQTSLTSGLQTSLSSGLRTSLSSGLQTSLSSGLQTSLSSGLRTPTISTPLASPSKSNSLLCTPKVDMRPLSDSSHLQLVQNVTKNISSLLATPEHNLSVPEIHIPEGDSQLPLLELSLGSSFGFDDSKVRIKDSAKHDLMLESSLQDSFATSFKNITKAIDAINSSEKITHGDTTNAIMNLDCNQTVDGKPFYITVNDGKSFPPNLAPKCPPVGSFPGGKPPSESTSERLFDIALGNSNSNSSFTSMLVSAVNPLSEIDNSSLLNTPPRRAVPSSSNNPFTCSMERLSPSSSPSRLIPKEDQQWLGGEVADFSLTSLLGSFESPSKSSGAPSAVPPSNVSGNIDNAPSEAPPSFVLNENGVDFTAKFDALASSGSSQ